MSFLPITGRLNIPSRTSSFFEDTRCVDLNVLFPFHCSPRMSISFFRLRPLPPSQGSNDQPLHINVPSWFINVLYINMLQWCVYQYLEHLTVLNVCVYIVEYNQCTCIITNYYFKLVLRKYHARKHYRSSNLNLQFEPNRSKPPDLPSLLYNSKI